MARHAVASQISQTEEKRGIMAGAAGSCANSSNLLCKCVSNADCEGASLVRQLMFVEKCTWVWRAQHLSCHQALKRWSQRTFRSLIKKERKSALFWDEDEANGQA
jgi:hypothetical protein